MDKASFVDAVAKSSNLTRSQVSAALRGIEAVTAAELKESGASAIPGLIAVRRMMLGERIVKNPKTGASQMIGPTVLVKAKPMGRFAKRIKTENALPAA